MRPLSADWQEETYRVEKAVESILRHRNFNLEGVRFRIHTSDMQDKKGKLSPGYWGEERLTLDDMLEIANEYSHRNPIFLFWLRHYVIRSYAIFNYIRNEQKRINAER